MKVLTWNIACLPRKINLYRNPNLRINDIISKIDELEPDIICLQEVFDYKIRNLLETHYKNKKYNIYYSYDKSFTLPKNGLFTCSKLPIFFQEDLDYCSKVGVEKVINKGIITIGIKHPSGLDVFIHNTHMQSDTNFWSRTNSLKCRRKQHIELIQYLNKFNKRIQYLVGDLNDKFNFINELQCYPNTFLNNEKIITFPNIDDQLDYIIGNNNFGHTFEMVNCIDNKLSDHNILMCDIFI
jgi:exonuclease III